MTFRIAKISNTSAKSILLTNPVSTRDTHLIIKGESIIPKNRPKIEYIKEAIIPFEEAIKKALSIYTYLGNWCFWDVGSDTSLMVFYEGGFPQYVFPRDPSPLLELNIGDQGMPHFYKYE